MNATALARQLWDGLLDLVYPSRCIACDRLGDGLFCAACLEAVSPISPPFCPRCHEPNDDGGCPGCRADPPPFRLARCASLYEDPLRIAVRGLKYGRKEALAVPLGELLARAWFREPDLRGAEIILPVPIHRHRESERGFNQSALLGWELSERIGRPLEPHALVRASYRRPQVGLNRIERRENVRECFAVTQPETLKGKSILLVDDVLTTGATCGEATKALLEAGAGEVYVLALAREPFRPKS